MEILEEFTRAIDEVIPLAWTRDRVIWAPLSSGRFSCRSFRWSIGKGGVVRERRKLP